VRDPDWLDTVPTDRPAIITADGLMGFLTKDELVSLLDRLISHFPAGRWSSTAAPGSPSGWPGTPAAPSRWPSSSSFPASTTPHDLEGWNPKLKLVKEIALSREPEIGEFPPAQRLYYRLQARSTSWSRTGTIVLHYRF
jgi:O-methyltransferase involved in polyketide biosynthesis